MAKRMVCTVVERKIRKSFKKDNNLSQIEGMEIKMALRMKRMVCTVVERKIRKSFKKDNNLSQI
jgi:hypothetical protein